MTTRARTSDRAPRFEFLGYQQTSGTQHDDAQARLEQVYRRLIEVALQRRTVRQPEIQEMTAPVRAEGSST